MFKGRVLVVDDLSDWRTTLTGLLTDAGYDVRSAANRAEALALMVAGRFHVAALDVRLDETDPDNQEGLELMRDLKAIDPTMAIIILTGYANHKMVQLALRPGRDGAALAFDFMEKVEANELPEVIRQAIDEYLNIDLQLKIKNSDLSLLRLTRQIHRFLEPKRPPEAWVDELEELLRKLFYGREQIEIHTIRQGFSKAAVFEVIPWFQDRARGQTRIVKIGGHRLIETEINQHQVIRERIGADRLPAVLSVAHTRYLSGMVYTLIGLETATAIDFTSFFAEKTDTATMQQVLRNLFLETYFPWQQEAKTQIIESDLKENYLTHIKLRLENLASCLEKTMGGRHPFTMDSHNPAWLCLNHQFKLLNPVRFLETRTFIAPLRLGLIHGDLHGYNVLVDHQHQTWLIDFADTGQGPVLQDYVSFEAFLRLSLVKSHDWPYLYGWANELDGAPDFFQPILPAAGWSDETISRVHHAVLGVRQLALERYPQATATEYQLGLLCNALRLITMMGLPAEQRDHALIMAAVLAEHLDKLGEE